MTLLQLQQHLLRFYSSISKTQCCQEIEAIICILNSKMDIEQGPVDYLPRTVSTIEKSILLAHKLALSFNPKKKQASLDISMTNSRDLSILLDIRENGIKHIFNNEPQYDLEVLKLAFDNETYSVNHRVFDNNFDTNGLDFFNGNVVGAYCVLKSRKNDNMLTTTINIDELNSIARFYNTDNLTPHFCYRQLLKRAIKTLYTPHDSVLFNLKEALSFQDALKSDNKEFKQLSQSELATYL